MNQTLLDCRDILALLPHRYPFMLVDRVIGYDPEKSLTAIKNVTYNAVSYTHLTLPTKA